jgi:hypothetical protein
MLRLSFFLLGIEAFSLLGVEVLCIMMFDVLCRKQSGVLDQLKADKENVPPQIISNTIQMLARTNRVPATNPRGKWSSESLKVAMDAVERGIIFYEGPTSFGAYP